MANGFVLLHRQIMESGYWLSEPFTRAQAWIDLIMLANHKDGWFRCRGVQVEVKRGQSGYGSVALASRWKWSRGKVNRFLKELEKNENIVQQKSNVTTLITIVNYDKFQENNTANGQQTDSKRTLTNNDNNDNKKDSPRNSFSDDDLSLAKHMYSQIKILMPASKEPNYETWANTIRLMREKDKLELTDIRDVFDWANSDDFWGMNIRGPEKLRKQYPVLSVKAKKINGHEQPKDWI